MAKLKWKNLLEDRCPKCGFAIFANDPGVHCSMVGSGCDFFITQERLQELKREMGDQAMLDRIDSQDNQSMLSEL